MNPAWIFTNSEGNVLFKIYRSDSTKIIDIQQNKFTLNPTLVSLIRGIPVGILKFRIALTVGVAFLASH
ncbi:hypothetical protein CMK12_11165 [Candidatus Poribacteria bacterium]|nr:hypothetical protein [Candidatus Poribacteria bacterium]